MASRLATRTLSPSLVYAWRRAISRPQRTWLVRTQASVATDGPAVTVTNRAEATLKRFWKKVDLKDNGEVYAITLDNRQLKTPEGNPLLIPKNKRIVASLIVAEWENQETLLKPHALPMTSIASRTIDALGNETTRAQVRKALLEYLKTDTVCFHQNEPPAFVALQEQHWVPLLEWARETFKIEIQTTNGFLMSTQPPETVQKLDAVISELDPWELAAFERATYTSKSFIIALALVKKHLTAEQAALASQVEVASQIQKWGEVEDTHDVDHHDVRRLLGSAAVLLSDF